MTAMSFPVDFGASFETKQIDADGFTISVTIGGSGPALLATEFSHSAKTRLTIPLLSIGGDKAEGSCIPGPC